VTLNWKSISAEHVRVALKQIGATKSGDRTSGLVVIDGSRKLPAKDVIRTAYRLANNLPQDATVKFSSGDGTLKVLNDLGFRAERLGANKST
jgi:hypothetical protein